MTKAQHTPGPWNVTKHEDCDAAIITAGHESLAFVYIDDNDKPATEINKADARLIAAAPELLEALEQLMPLFREYCRQEKDLSLTAKCGNAYEVAHSVITKAKGE